MDTKCGTAFEIRETIAGVAKEALPHWIRTLCRWSQLDRADDMKGLGISERPFENEMVCYPFVVEDNGRRLMFYNGNGFGQGGIGVAEWVDQLHLTVYQTAHNAS